MGALGAVLFIVTLFDRTIPRLVATAGAESGDSLVPNRRKKPCRSQNSTTRPPWS
jgi:hypothetical protein